MAGRLTPYLVGSTCEVKIGDVTVMFGQNVSMQDMFQNQQPYGLGEFSSRSNEPIQYTGGSVSMNLLKYTDAVLGLDGATLSGKEVSAVLNTGTNRIVKAQKKTASDGNSLAFVESVNPSMLMFETTVDIIIYAKTSNEGGATESVPVYKAIDCLLESYSENHGASSLSNMSYSFRARLIQDMTNEPNKDKNNT